MPLRGRRGPGGHTLSRCVGARGTPDDQSAVSIAVASSGIAQYRRPRRDGLPDTRPGPLRIRSQRASSLAWTGRSPSWRAVRPLWRERLGRSTAINGNYHAPWARARRLARPRPRSASRRSSRRQTVRGNVAGYGESGVAADAPGLAAARPLRPAARGPGLPDARTRRSCRPALRRPRGRALRHHWYGTGAGRSGRADAHPAPAGHVAERGRRRLRAGRHRTRGAKTARTVHDRLGRNTGRRYARMQHVRRPRAAGGPARRLSDSTPGRTVRPLGNLMTRVGAVPEVDLSRPALRDYARQADGSRTARQPVRSRDGSE